MEKILVVSPHPDDETLGAGGSIFKFKAEGNQVYWLNITAILSEQGWEEEIIKKKQIQIEKINQLYQFDDFLDLKLPTTRLDSLPTANVLQSICDYIRKVEPNILILPDYNDVHSDHRIVFEWLFSCSKVFRFPYIRKILTMEILSETDFGKIDNHFVPNVFVDISEFCEKKVEALQIYENEIGEMPFPRSIESVRALYTIRGVAAGCMAAEGFRLIKEII